MAGEELFIGRALRIESFVRIVTSMLRRVCRSALNSPPVMLVLRMATEILLVVTA